MPLRSCFSSSESLGRSIICDWGISWPYPLVLASFKFDPCQRHFHLGLIVRKPDVVACAAVRVRVQLGFEPRGWVYKEIVGCRVTASAAVAEWPRQSKRCLLRFGDRSYL